MMSTFQPLLRALGPGLWASFGLATILMFGSVASAAVTIPPADISSLNDAARQVIEDARAQVREAESGTVRALGSAFGELGMTYQAHDLLDAAVAAYREALQRVPDDARWSYLMAFALAQQGQTEEAVAAYRQSIESNDAYAPAYYRLARFLLEQGRTDEAGQLFLQTINRWPQGAAGYAGLGELALQREDYSEAISQLEKALELQPQADRLRYPLAQALQRSGEEQAAAEQLAQRGTTEALFPDPVLAAMHGQSRSVNFFMSRGQAAAQQGDYMMAAARFQQALKVDPDNVAAMVNAARAFEAAGRAEASAALMEQALTTEPSNPDVLFVQAGMLKRQGKPQQARQMLLDLVETQPDFAPAVLALGDAYMAEKQFDQALSVYRKLREADPAAASLRMGLAYLAANECQRAIASLSDGRSAQPDDAALAEYYVRAVATCPEATTAQKQQALGVARALYEGQASISIVEARAMIEAALGMFDEALATQSEAIFQALKQDPDSPRPGLKANLQRYENQQPAASPWHPDRAPFSGAS